MLFPILEPSLPVPHTTLALGFGNSGFPLKLQVRLDPLLSLLVSSPFRTHILLCYFLFAFW